MSKILGGHPDEVPLTDEEKKAIRALNRVAKIWPKSLWLFSASGSLNVMRCDADGDHAYDDATCGVDQDYSIENIDIPNDGGDW
jgi:hypothetical protein